MSLEIRNVHTESMERLATKFVLDWRTRCHTEGLQDKKVLRSEVDKKVKAAFTTFFRNPEMFKKYMNELLEFAHKVETNAHLTFSNSQSQNPYSLKPAERKIINKKVECSMNVLKVYALYAFQESLTPSSYYQTILPLVDVDGKIFIDSKDSNSWKGALKEYCQSMKNPQEIYDFIKVVFTENVEINLATPHWNSCIAQVGELSIDSLNLFSDGFTNLFGKSNFTFNFKSVFNSKFFVGYVADLEIYCKKITDQCSKNPTIFSNPSKEFCISSLGGKYYLFLITSPHFIKRLGKKTCKYKFEDQEIFKPKCGVMPLEFVKSNVKTCEDIQKKYTKNYGDNFLIPKKIIPLPFLRYESSLDFPITLEQKGIKSEKILKKDNSTSKSPVSKPIPAISEKTKQPEEFKDSSVNHLVKVVNKLEVDTKPNVLEDHKEPEEMAIQNFNSAIVEQAPEISIENSTITIEDPIAELIKLVGQNNLSFKSKDIGTRQEPKFKVEVRVQVGRRTQVAEGTGPNIKTAKKRAAEEYLKGHLVPQNKKRKAQKSRETSSSNVKEIETKKIESSNHVTNPTPISAFEHSDNKGLDKKKVTILKRSPGAFQDLEKQVIVINDDSDSNKKIGEVSQIITQKVPNVKEKAKNLKNKAKDKIKDKIKKASDKVFPKKDTKTKKQSNENSNLTEVEINEKLFGFKTPWEHYFSIPRLTVFGLISSEMRYEVSKKSLELLIDKVHYKEIPNEPTIRRVFVQILNEHASVYVIHEKGEEEIQKLDDLEKDIRKLSRKKFNLKNELKRRRNEGETFIKDDEMFIKNQDLPPLSSSVPDELISSDSENARTVKKILNIYIKPTPDETPPGQLIPHDFIEVEYEATTNFIRICPSLGITSFVVNHIGGRNTEVKIAQAKQTKEFYLAEIKSLENKLTELKTLAKTELLSL